MSATTMDAAVLTSAPATEVPPATDAGKPVISRLLKPVTAVLGGGLDAALWIWHFELGAAVLVGEQTARFVKAAVERGKEVEPSVTKPFRKAEESVSEALGDVGTRLKGMAKPAPANEDLRLELRELSSRIDGLTQRIEGLQAKEDAEGPRNPRTAHGRTPSHK
jgi:hypothetical protein